MKKQFIQYLKVATIILPITAFVLNCTKLEDPEISATSITGIASDQATFTAKITSLGNRTLSDYGFCYGTSEFPTLTDDFVSLGSPAIGEYSETINGFASSTVYFVRAYITSDSRTHYGSQGSFTSGSVSGLTLGQSHAGGEVAYIAGPGEPLYVEGEDHGFVVATTDQSESAQWGCLGTLITSANGEAIGTGLSNTNFIVDQCGEAGIAAKLCASLTFGGYSDWFLPSIDELRMMRDNKAAIPSFDSEDYYSSTQFDADKAKSLYTTSGAYSENYTKTNYCNVRAIRYF